MQSFVTLLDSSEASRRNTIHTVCHSASPPLSVAAAAAEMRFGRQGFNAAAMPPVLACILLTKVCQLVLHCIICYETQGLLLEIPLRFDQTTLMSFRKVMLETAWTFISSKVCAVRTRVSKRNVWRHQEGLILIVDGITQPRSKTVPWLGEVASTTLCVCTVVIRVTNRVKPQRCPM